MKGVVGWTYKWPYGETTRARGRPWTRSDVHGVPVTSLGRVWSSPMLAGIPPLVMEILIEK